MKRTAWIVICLLIAATLLLVACDKNKTPATDTEALVTSADTQAPAENATEPATSPAETVTEPAETTVAPEETTVFEPPVVNPDEAAAAGLPVDGNTYTVGGENPASDPKAQYDYLTVYAHAYEDKTFTLYGNIGEDERGNVTLSVGEGMAFVVYFDGVEEPMIGSYVKVDATFAKTVDRGDYVDFGCFTMMATACEVLGEAKGPNGGKLMYITASSLNIRTSSDTSTSDNIIGTYSKGDLVEVFEQDSKGWYRVVYNGQNAYISNKYVSETKP